MLNDTHTNKGKRRSNRKRNPDPVVNNTATATAKAEAEREAAEAAAEKERKALARAVKTEREAAEAAEAERLEAEAEAERKTQAEAEAKAEKAVDRLPFRLVALLASMWQTEEKRADYRPQAVVGYTKAGKPKYAARIMTLQADGTAIPTDAAPERAPIRVFQKLTADDAATMSKAGITDNNWQLYALAAYIRLS